MTEAGEFDCGVWYMGGIRCIVAAAIESGLSAWESVSRD